jgi:crotonobetainyl-CoA:carnitine CoA-transferase CaiB-like acyl-CoA transferase
MLGTPWVSKPAPALASRVDGAGAQIPAAGERPAMTSIPSGQDGILPRDRPAAGLLAGVRVLDFTAYWAGPFATKWLADFGAEVVKVESPALMDFIRSTTVDPGHERPWDYSAYFNNYNRGKKSLTLDPANPLGRQVLLEMLPQFDVVVENFKAGRMVDLKLGYEDLKAVKQDIVMVSISGYGQDGPDSPLAGVGTNMEQLSGLASLNRYSDSDQPYNTGIAYGDPTSGVTGAAAVAMALIHRDRTGEGQYIEISGHETIAALIGEQFAALSLGLKPEPKGNRHPDMAPHGCYPCTGEDRWVTVAARDDDEWRALCELIARPDLSAQYPGFEARKAGEDEIDAAIIGWTVLHDDYEAAALLQAQGIPAGPVLSTLGVVNDPHFRLRGYHVTVDHPDQGPWPHDGIAWRLSRTPGAVRGPAPRFGQHTRELLGQYLGKTGSEIDAIYDSKAAADAPFRR